MLLAHPASASIDPPCCKFNARLHRQVQMKPVRIVHLVAQGTIDERVLKVIAEKDSVQNSLLHALKP